MSKMADLHMQINDLLDNTKFMIEEIANILESPETWVEEVVLERWEKIKEEVGITND